MRLMVISLVLFFLSSVSALDFNFSSPEKVKLNETFNVSIFSANSDSYDIKIFVHNSEDQTITRSELISSIFSDKWQDSWPYILSSFSDIKTYNLKVTKSPGNREICVQLRKVGKTAYYKECKPLLIEEFLTSQQQEELDKFDKSLDIETKLQNILQEITTKQYNLRNIIIVSSFFVVLIILFLLSLKKL